MGATKIPGFLRIQTCVYPTEDHDCALLARDFPDLISSQSIAGVDADPDDVALGYG